MLMFNAQRERERACERGKARGGARVREKEQRDSEKELARE